MTYPDFEARWKNSGGAERANYGLFLQDLCDLLDVPRPNPTTDDPTQDSYVLERAVQFNDGAKKSTGRIDLYKRGCFVLETKQGTDTADQQKKQERAELGLEPSKRRKGHAVRGSAKWAEMMQAAGPQPWPTELAQQMQAVRDAVQQAGQSVSAAQVAARFKRTKPEKVQPLLDTLSALSLLRQTEEGA